MTGSSFRTLAQLPDLVATRHPGHTIISRCRAGGTDDLATGDYIEAIRRVSLSLIDAGLEAGDRVAIAAETRPEWQLADLAILTAGGVTVPVYPTLAAEQVQYVLADSGARIAFVSNERQAAKLESIRRGLPGIEHVVAFDDVPSVQGGGPRATAWREWLARGATLAQGGHLDAVRHRRIEAVTPHDLATIIYTSGTTGEPKGVMLTHGNLVANVLATGQVLQLSGDDVAMSFLPLSHSFERMVVYLYLYSGVRVAFAESIETISRDLAIVRPTVMTGVPRVYEKMQARILEAVAASPPLSRRLFAWALDVGRSMARARSAGRRPPRWLSVQGVLADSLVHAKIRRRMGGRFRYLVSGSAPLPVPVAEFFQALGLTILEGYGLTETSPVLTVNPPDAPRFGTVGRPVPGVEIRIAEDGEILARGPNVMRGYYNKPEATNAVLENGWFHTGDIGRLDADGYLAITDRKKDIIVTSGGKKIPPQPIEARLQSHPLVAEALLIGDRRKFPALLIVPDFQALAARLGEKVTMEDRDTLVRRADVLALFEPLVEEVNAGLAQFERIKRFALLPTEFQMETGELTPTMKVRRRVVEERWQGVIEELYR